MKKNISIEILKILTFLRNFFLHLLEPIIMEDSIAIKLATVEATPKEIIGIKVTNHDKFKILFFSLLTLT